ncbi:MAG: hypothetical protein EZS28_036056, partial [Streblomastix strix]
DPEPYSEDGNGQLPKQSANNEQEQQEHVDQEQENALGDQDGGENNLQREASMGQELWNVDQEQGQENAQDQWNPSQTFEDFENYQPEEGYEENGEYPPQEGYQEDGQYQPGEQQDDQYQPENIEDGQYQPDDQEQQYDQNDDYQPVDMQQGSNIQDHDSDLIPSERIQFNPALINIPQGQNHYNTQVSDWKTLSSRSNKTDRDNNQTDRSKASQLSATEMAKRSFKNKVRQAGADVDDEGEQVVDDQSNWSDIHSFSQSDIERQESQGSFQSKASEFSQGSSDGQEQQGMSKDPSVSSMGSQKMEITGDSMSFVNKVKKIDHKVMVAFLENQKVKLQKELSNKGKKGQQLLQDLDQDQAQKLYQKQQDDAKLSELEQRYIEFTREIQKQDSDQESFNRKMMMCEEEYTKIGEEKKKQLISDQKWRNGEENSALKDGEIFGNTSGTFGSGSNGDDEKKSFDSDAAYKMKPYIPRDYYHDIDNDSEYDSLQTKRSDDNASLYGLNDQPYNPGDIYYPSIVNFPLASSLEDP